MSESIDDQARLVALNSLPPEMVDHQLLDWKTVAVLLGSKDVEYTRETLTTSGLPLVHLSERRKLPRWGELRKWIEDRESVSA